MHTHLKFLFEKLGWAIPLVFLVSLLILKFSWKGIDGHGYERIITSDGKGYYMYLPNLILSL